MAIHNMYVYSILNKQKRNTIILNNNIYLLFFLY